MGRSKEFKDDETLDKAISVFWKKGYSNTSLKDLLSEMEILNGSFYNSFGNKKNVFIKALEKYQRDFKIIRHELFKSDGTFNEKIRTLFNASFDQQKDKTCPNGCFLANSISGEVLEDIDILNLVKDELKEFESFLEEQLDLAKDKNEISSSINSKETASIILAYLHGIMKLSMISYSDRKFRNQTEYLLTALGL